MSHPYKTLPERAFWRNAVAAVNPLEIGDLWVPKYAISRQDRVITFGSCFAQHISRALRENGYTWFDGEPGPAALPPEVRRKYNYGIFSARTGNIYTTKLLLQWLQWAFGTETPPQEVWERQGRYYDPFRPAIEPEGFESPEELLASRGSVLAALRRAFEAADVFVFTLGLTESWEHARDGFCYAVCPGTVAGDFDPETHVFANYSVAEVQRDLEAALALIRRHNPDLRVLLTVSPVPLTATAADQHVLVSTTYSKSVLRAVAGAVAAADPGVDYFPSYEIITAPPYRGMFYDPNARTISLRGVAHVMEQFMAGLAGAAPSEDAPAPAAAAAEPRPAPEPEGDEADDLKCEEAMLEAFAPGQ